jgi:hypothetical protein
MAVVNTLAWGRTWPTSTSPAPAAQHLGRCGVAETMSAQLGQASTRARGAHDGGHIATAQ